jgi:hypothetical protein
MNKPPAFQFYVKDIINRVKSGASSLQTRCAKQEVRGQKVEELNGRARESVVGLQEVTKRSANFANPTSTSWLDTTRRDRSLGVSGAIARD